MLGLVALLYPVPSIIAHRFQSLQVSDLLMDEAIIQLHRSGYKIDDALSELNANDIILTTDVDNMTQDDAKKFAKGIKQLGKNFSRIHRELLPHHSRVRIWKSRFFFVGANKCINMTRFFLLFPI